jgi:acylphosphatase
MAEQLDTPDNFAVHVRTQGLVQGVWFRNWTVEEATKRKLRGWVRNRNDGSVEAVFVGDEPEVRDMVAACRRGPPKAQVNKVIQIPGEYRPDETELPPGFKVLPSV